MFHSSVSRWQSSYTDCHPASPVSCLTRDCQNPHQEFMSPELAIHILLTGRYFLQPMENARMDLWEKVSPFASQTIHHRSSSAPVGGSPAWRQTLTSICTFRCVRQVTYPSSIVSRHTSECQWFQTKIAPLRKIHIESYYKNVLWKDAMIRFDSRCMPNSALWHLDTLTSWAELTFSNSKCEQEMSAVKEHLSFSWSAIKFGWNSINSRAHLLVIQEAMSREIMSL